MIGWFGKLPALGDFASRRLPEQFLQVWDDWLCIEITRAREVLGPDWDRAYAAAPSWRFALMPQVTDPNTWYGLFTPSTDRVGRQFPLTFAASSAGTPSLPVSWWIDLMDVASRATQPTCDADALESLLAEVEARAALQPAPVAAEAPTLLQPLAGLSTMWWRRERAAGLLWRSASVQSAAQRRGLPAADRFHPRRLVNCRCSKLINYQVLSCQASLCICTVA